MLHCIVYHVWTIDQAGHAFHAKLPPGNEHDEKVAEVETVTVVLAVDERQYVIRYEFVRVAKKSKPHETRKQTVYLCFNVWHRLAQWAHTYYARCRYQLPEIPVL